MVAQRQETINKKKKKKKLGSAIIRAGHGFWGGHVSWLGNRHTSMQVLYDKSICHWCEGERYRYPNTGIIYD